MAGGRARRGEFSAHFPACFFPPPAPPLAWSLGNRVCSLRTGMLQAQLVTSQGRMYLLPAPEACHTGMTT